MSASTTRNASARPIADRYGKRVEVDQSAKRRAADVERETRTRQVHAEASQALPLVTTDYNAAEIASVVERSHITSVDSAPSKSNKSSAVAKEGTCSAPGLEIKLSDEQSSKTSLQVELQAAEDRIKELERLLSNADTDLKDSILQDRDEDIQRQQRVIENLKEQLDVVEDERNRLRQQFRESETKVWELEGQIRDLRHHQGDLPNQVDANSCQARVEDGMQLHGDLKNCESRSGKGSANTHLRAAEKSGPKSPMLARRRGKGLWFVT